MNDLDAKEEWIPTRQSLLTRLKNWDDAKSWQEFFDTYWRLIYAVARKAGLNDAEAQDVVQETVIEIAGRMRDFKYDSGGSFKAWLLTLTQWRIMDQFRKRELASHPDNAVDRKTDVIERVSDSTTDERLSEWWDDQWQHNLMEVALDKVKPRVGARTFQIFQLHVMKDWPVEKVARTLGVGKAQIYVAKHRVSTLVRKEVTKLAKRFH